MPYYDAFETYNWCSELKEIFHTLDLDYCFELKLMVDINLVQSKIHFYYSNIWANDVKNVPKLRTYIFFKKTIFGRENYVVFYHGYGKPRSLFCNKRTVIGKLMHIIVYNENKYVELICENKDVLVNFTSWIYFLSMYIALIVCFHLFEMRSELFRVTPHHLNTVLFYGIENQ
jgi:hypothetical protein